MDQSEAQDRREERADLLRRRFEAEAKGASEQRLACFIAAGKADGYLEAWRMFRKDPEKAPARLLELAGEAGRQAAVKTGVWAAWWKHRREALKDAASWTATG